MGADATRICPVCGTRFQPRTWNHRYCTGFRGRCYRRAMNHAQRTREGRQTIPLDAPLPAPFNCGHCGKRCVPGENVARHATMFCSSRCKKREHRDRNREAA